MKTRSILAAVPICAGLVFAQTAGTDLNRSTQGQTFSGILVASGCDASSMSGAWNGRGDRKNQSGDAAGVNRSAGALDRTEQRTSGDASSDMNRAASTANQTGVDQSGSLPRGTQPENMKRNTVGDRSVNTPQTGMADRDRGGDTSATSGSDKGMESGSAKTGGWDRACFISPATASFALVTKDGKQMLLDDASNQMVSQRLSSNNRVSEKSKVFRVRITGDKSGETVHITEIQL